MKKLNELNILIVGLGQIGGSIGIDLVGRNMVAEVAGFDIDRSVIDQALAGKAIDRAADSLKEGITDSDLVILSAPIRKIIEMIPVVCENINDSSAILDMAGTKTEIMAAVAACGRVVNYIGGHPLAGNEGRGLGSAEKGKFEGHTFVLTPYEGVDENWLDIADQLLSKIGARPLIMSAEKHDQSIALTSHLPYAVALVLMQMMASCVETDNRVQKLAGGSYRSATRVAKSSPELILDMFMTNRKNIAIAIDGMIGHLASLKGVIEAGDESGLSEIIKSSE